MEGAVAPKEYLQEKGYRLFLSIPERIKIPGFLSIIRLKRFAVPGGNKSIQKSFAP
jgi:hypothetical protein